MSRKSQRVDYVGRLLRLLVINDERTDLRRNFEHIEVVQPPSFLGHSVPYVGCWAQMVRLLFHNEVPEFDLLTIDIRFHDDLTDPLYFNESDGRGLAGMKAPNPLGL